MNTTRDSAEHTLNKELEVRLHGTRVGTLRGAPGNGLVFQYDRAYVASPHAPPLGTRSPLNEEPWSPNLTRRWFEGLLPEGDRRNQLARQLGIVHIDTWSLLEAAGDECAGAVQILAPGHQRTPKLFNLDQETLEGLLRPATAPIDEEHRAARLSLAGAQNKIVLSRHDDSATWQLPAYGHPSTHILKPAHPDFPKLVQNEHWCMEVSRRAGIDTARTSVERIGNIEVLVVTRYDRRRGLDGEIERVHQEDLAQALGSRTKYQDDGFPNTYDLAGVPGVDANKLFDRLIVNWLLGNCDAHAKNYSILEPGTPRARLAPVYDIVSTEAYEKLGQTMGTSIGNARTLNTVTRNAIEHMGRKLNVETPALRASRLAERVIQAIHICAREGVSNGPVNVKRIRERAAKATQHKTTRARSQSGAESPAEAARMAGLGHPPEVMQRLPPSQGITPDRGRSGGTER